MPIDWSTWGPVLAAAAGTGVSAYAQSRSAGKNRAAQLEENAADRALTEQQHLRQTGLDESKLDPFRQQMAQQRNLFSLDMLLGAGKPRGVTPPSNVAPYAGQRQGQYAPSADMLKWLGLGQQDIASGHTAPTMTDPNNYGKTSALDLLSMAAGKPGTPGGRPSDGAGAGAAFDPAQYYGGHNRRNEGAGGVVSGMKTGAKYGFGTPTGIAIGGIAGAFTKNAKTAATDFSVDDAKAIVAQAYQSELGRPASPEEIQTHLQNIGWKPGHQWVGEQGLSQIIRAIRNDPAATEYQSRGLRAA